MNSLTINRKQRKRRNKKNSTKIVEPTVEDVMDPQIDVDPDIDDSTPELPFRVVNLQELEADLLEEFQRTLAVNVTNALIDRFVQLCLREDMIIFGGYVRDYLAKRTFNHNVSDVDIFSTNSGIGTFTKLLEKNGFYIDENRENDNEYDVLNEKPFDVAKFLVTKFSIGLMNDELFLGRKIEIKVDFVVSKSQGQPPFKTLDFECNAWIWDQHGIRLSQNTGTELDTLSPRDIKDREALMIDDLRKRITTYYPIVRYNELDFIDEASVRRRKIRVERLLRMMCRGWVIKNNPIPIELFSYNKGDNCNICQDTFNSYCLKSTCCEMKYHYSCYIAYTKSELDERIHIRCPQRCCSFTV